MNTRTATIDMHPRATFETSTVGSNDNMNRNWLKSYPAGVPAEIDMTRYASIGDLFEESFRKHGPKPAFACMGKSISYTQLDRLSRRLAA